jgi:hypothetical protein
MTRTSRHFQTIFRDGALELFDKGAPPQGSVLENTTIRPNIFVVPPVGFHRWTNESASARTYLAGGA